MSKPYVSEAVVQSAIESWLALHGYGVYRNNTAAARGGRLRCGLREYDMKRATGGPDLLVVKAGRCWGLEIKSPDAKPRKDQDNQREWAERWSEVHGMPYAIVRSATEALAFIEQGSQTERNAEGGRAVLAAIAKAGAKQPAERTVA